MGTSNGTVPVFGSGAQWSYPMPTDCYFGKLSHLEWLPLFVPRISDAGLGALEELTNLIELHLKDTQVTDAGIKRLLQMSLILNIIH